MWNGTVNKWRSWKIIYFKHMQLFFWHSKTAVPHFKIRIFLQYTENENDHYPQFTFSVMSVCLKLVVILKRLPFFLKFCKNVRLESGHCLHLTPWNLSGLFNFVPWLCIRTFDQSSVYNIVLMYFCGSFLLGTNYFFFLEMRWFVMGPFFAETPVNPPTLCTRSKDTHVRTHTFVHF